MLTHILAATGGFVIGFFSGRESVLISRSSTALAVEELEAADSAAKAATKAATKAAAKVALAADSAAPKALAAAKAAASAASAKAAAALEAVRHHRRLVAALVEEVNKAA